MNMPGKTNIPLAVLAAGLLGLLAVLAAAALRWLFLGYAQFAAAADTAAAVQYSRLLVQRLAREDFLAAPPDNNRYARFQTLAEALHQVEPQLEYLTLLDGETVLYHWQAPWGSASNAADEEAATAQITVSPRILQKGAQAEPVLDFSVNLPPTNCNARQLHLGFQKKILEKRQANNLGLERMLRTAWWMVGGAWLASLLAVGLLMWRELRRLGRRAWRENLDFAGAVAAAVMHDFRNPMSALRLDMQLLRRETEKGAAAQPARLAELARRSEAALARMEEMLNEFLALAGPQSQGMPERFDVNQAVRESVELLKLRFERAGITPVLQLINGPLLAQGFPTPFKRALLNVLNNAGHFAPAGTSVMVQTARCGRWAEISVADRGPGIPRTERKKVFEMFYSRRPGGTGLGLALARAAMLQCRGEIRILDNPQGGCLVLLRLPMAKMRAAAESSPARHSTA